MLPSKDIVELVATVVNILKDHVLAMACLGSDHSNTKTLLPGLWHKQLLKVTTS